MLVSVHTSHRFWEKQKKKNKKTAGSNSLNQTGTHYAHETKSLRRQVYKSVKNIVQK